MRSPQNWCLHSEFLIQCFRTDPRVKLRDSSVVRFQNPDHRPAHDQHTILLGGIRAVTPDHGVGDGIGTVEMVQCRQTPPGALHTIDRHAVRTVVLGPGWDLGLEIMGKRHIRRKFRSQTSDNMDRWKAEQGRGREKRKIRRKKSRRERVRRKKMQMREKVGKSRNIVFFQWFGAPEGRKVGSLKRRVRSQLARWEMKNCTPFICKSKCAKHLGLGALLEVEMSKKCTPLWREAHFQVKMYKAHHVRTIFGGSEVVSRGRRKGLWTLSKVTKTCGFCTIFNYNHHYTTLHYNYTFTTFYYTPLHYTTLHSITLKYTKLHYITLHSTTLHYITLRYTTQHYTTLHSTTLPSTTLH